MTWPDLDTSVSSAGSQVALCLYLSLCVPDCCIDLCAYLCTQCATLWQDLYLSVIGMYLIVPGWLYLLVMGMYPPACPA